MLTARHQFLQQSLRQRLFLIPTHASVRHHRLHYLVHSAPPVLIGAQAISKR